MKKAVVFSLLGGFVLGKAGGFIFGSKTAKKAYTAIATGALIAKDSVMENVEKIQAEASDIIADAKVNVEAYYEERGEAGYYGADASDCKNGADASDCKSAAEVSDGSGVDDVLAFN